MTLPKQNLVAYYPLEAATTPNLTCETCQHWRTVRPTDYLGDCAVGAVYGRVRFDYAPCAQHTSNAPMLTQQSEARGMTYQQWQAKVRG